ncbi:DUF6677 family protein [uncultured Methanobrevibacter sp.]|uniref:DUF6677 family protein n=1 Tax=uncultured Methanobrevibacter sp. TaxID=253161 RepID=UPI0025F70C25|nr:DUF6677 family protein [uncultured Methanobrevibacter sp.]
MHPLLAAILTFIIPGLGQALSGDVQKGVIYFVIFAIITIFGMFIFRSWVVSIIRLIYRLYAAYDAYQIAQ